MIESKAKDEKDINVSEKKVAAYLKKCRSIDEMNPEDDCFDVDMAALADAALAHSHSCLNKYSKVSEEIEKETLSEMSTLLTDIKDASMPPLNKCRDLVDLMEKWLKGKEGDACDIDKKRNLLLAIGFFLKVLPLRVANLPFIARALVPKNLLSKISTLTKSVKKNLKRIDAS